MMKFYLYPSGLTGPMVPTFFHNRASLQEAMIGRISRKYQILINFNQITLLPKYFCFLNNYIKSDLYTKANKFFVINISYVGFINVKDNLLQAFRQKLNDPDLNLNRLYEFKCNRTTAVTIQKEDFVLPNFKFKAEFSDPTAKDEVKKIFDSAYNILIKPDKEVVAGDLKGTFFVFFHLKEKK